VDEQRNVLTVRNLNISYQFRSTRLPVVRDFQLAIQAGQIYGLVGESGSGKSSIGAAIMRYLPRNGQIEPGSSIDFLGTELLAQTSAQMRRHWATNLKLVPQTPGAALNPSIRIGEQVAEIIRLYAGVGREKARTRVIHAFSKVSLPDPEVVYDRYPHQLSGGQQQRVMIAMALITSPALLVLDEPTTNLDVTTEATILDLVETLIRQEQTGALYITHNMGVVAQVCDRVTVLYAGEVMEDGTVDDIFAHPAHPYTIGLLSSIPGLGQMKHVRPLMGISGQPPSLAERSPGCVFAPRCPLAIEICSSSKPPLESPAQDRLVRCHRWREVASGQVGIQTAEKLTTNPPIVSQDQRLELLHVKELVKEFPGSRSLVDILRRTSPAPVRAVDGVSLQVQQGCTYGLVGESGSGKTTLSRVIIGLLEPTSGHVEFMRAQLQPTVLQRGKEVLARLQMIFQNPQDSLNPHHTVGKAILRPLTRLAGLSQEEARAEMLRLLEAVSLRPDHADRFPDELSGGEKQRVAIARAFATDPSLVICDEPVSFLDASVQSAVLNLLARLQDERGTSYLFISHDLAVVGYLADTIAVMYLGELFEVGSARDLFSLPVHPYTEVLVSAIPLPDPNQHRRMIHLSADIPSPGNKPTGCAFHTRCPHKVGVICEQESPAWRTAGSEHFIRCHRTPEELADLQTHPPREGQLK
jgi:peptide/nickel transport system ATP-binding protein